MMLELQRDPPALPVSKQWLQDLINKEYRTDLTIKTVDCEIIGEGKGFVSFMTKATISWETDPEDDSDVPRNIVFKKPTDEKIRNLPMFEDFFKEEGFLAKLHNTEVKAYDYFTRHDPPPFPMAKCLYKEEMTDPGTGLIILEHIAGRSLTFNDNNNLEQLKVLAGYIGSVQAYGILHPEYKDIFGGMPFNAVDKLIEGIPTGASFLRERYPSLFHLSDADVEKGIAIAKKSAEILLKPERNPYTKVIALGDMQPNNVLWKVETDGSLSDEVAALLDFQVVHIGMCFGDLSNVLGLGIPTDKHDEWIEEILNHYHKTLSEKVQGRPVPVTMKEVSDGYKALRVVRSIFGLSGAVMMDKHKDALGISDEKVEEMIRKLLKGFVDIDSEEVADFLKN